MKTMKPGLSSIVGPALVVAALCLTGPPARAQQCGVNWAAVSNVPTGNYLRAVAYQGGQFVAAGDKGTILTSPDGLAWSLRPTSASDTLFGIAYGNGRYVAAGDNALLWSAVTAPTQDDIYSITFGPDQLVNARHYGAVLTRPDSRSWTSRTSPTTLDLLGMDSVAASPGSDVQWG